MSEQPGTYARHLKMLNEICRGWYFGAKAAAFDKLLEYGWIKPSGQPGENCSRQWIDEYRAAPWYDGFDHSWFYVPTEKGHSVLAPTDNRVVWHRPLLTVTSKLIFDVSSEKGLNVRWGMYKRRKRTERATPRVLALVRMLVATYRPYDFTRDGRQFVWLSDYLDEQEQQA